LLSLSGSDARACGISYVGGVLEVAELNVSESDSDRQANHTLRKTKEDRVHMIVLYNVGSRHNLNRTKGEGEYLWRESTFAKHLD
jgi:hypothetical protein